MKPTNSELKEKLITNIGEPRQEILPEHESHQILSDEEISSCPCPDSKNMKCKNLVDTPSFIKNFTHMSPDDDEIPADKLWYNPKVYKDISHGVKRRLGCIIVICLIFIAAEVAGGLISGSTAILADASHLFCDLIGFVLSYVAVSLGQKGKTKKMSFGYHRAEIIGA